MARRAIIWFRNDLRIHDNESLQEAIESADEVVPVYVFDERIFNGQTSFGFRKTGIHRTRFIIESVIDLRSNLRSIGTELIVRVGKPEDVLFELAQEIKSSWIFCNRERTSEEVKVQDALEKRLWTIGQEVRYNRGKMLYYTADLPFPVNHTPDVFTSFRKEVEKYIPVRDPLPSPQNMSPLKCNILAGEIPSLYDFGFKGEEVDNLSENKWKGGETKAIEQIDYYFWKTNGIADYKNTRNQLLGWDYSSKLSPYLSQGCISPKYVYHQLKKYENEVTKNDSTYWLFFELLWRDFFRLMGKKFGNLIFKVEGPKNYKKAWTVDKRLFNLWSSGKTGIPFIDANMRELNATGFMSNRGRQNVASFLVNDLGLNWIMGAEYFESKLLDYDPCSNYGNWNYLAGVGQDPRDNRSFNIHFQSRNYDPQGDYIKAWVKELKDVPSLKIHSPDEMSIEEQAEFNCIIGKDYPAPVINTSKWS